MQPMLGISLKLCAVFLFIIMSALIKAAVENVPPGEAVFFRSFFAIPIILIWLWVRGALRTGLKVASPMGHFWRGFAGTAAMGMTFAALALLPLPEQVALGYTAPLLTVVFAAMFLNEKVGLYRIGAVCLGLSGVIVILLPRFGAFDGSTVATAQALGAVLAITGAICAALAQIYIRKLVATEQTSAIVFYFAITSAALSCLTIPFGWVMPDGRDFVFLVLAGLFGGTAQIFLTSAYRFADASVVAPFDYASMVFALIIGYVFFDEIPTHQTLYGAALIIIAGIIIILREGRLNLKRDLSGSVKIP